MDRPLKNRMVWTKKQHKCFSCHRKFEAGTRMNYYVGIYEGDFGSSYSCLTCIEIMNMVQDPDNSGFPDGFVREMLDKNQTPEQLLESLTNK